MQLSNSTKGILLALLGASAWGAMGVAGQNVLQHFSFTPWDLVSLRLLCAGSILLILLFLQRGKAALAPMQNKRDAFDITLCGIMIGVSQLTFFLAIFYLNAGTATIFQSMTPLFMVLYLALFAHRRVRIFEMGCMLCAVVGVTLLVTKGDLSSVHLSLTGCLWSLAAIITFIVYTLQPKRVMARVGGTTPVVSWGIFIGGVIACFINPPWTSHAQWTWESSLCFAFIVIVGTVIALTAFLASTRYISPAIASMLTSAEPLVAVVLSVMLLGVTMTWIEIFGGVIIVVAVTAQSLNARRLEKEQAQVEAVLSARRRARANVEQQ